ncbi:hypothetical protein [Streptomyces sp. NPDC049879]|uniref:hypothetical protein n=1 Tax=Streptomyces sp. NPDC049879 TaxID=3365598 RepID=UPI0037BC42F3
MTGELTGTPYAVPGDGNEWLVGACWLWCGHRVGLVVRLGSVTVTDPPGEAPLYGCGSCVQRLHDAALDYAEVAADGPDGDRLYVAPGSPPGTERTRPRRLPRRPRTVLGRRWLRLAEEASGSAEEPALPAADLTSGGNVQHRVILQAVAAGLSGAAIGAVAALGCSEAARRALFAVDRRWWRAYRLALTALGEDPDDLDHDPPAPADVHRALNTIVLLHALEEAHGLTGAD